MVHDTHTVKHDVGALRSDEAVLLVCDDGKVARHLFAGEVVLGRVVGDLVSHDVEVWLDGVGW